MMPRMQGGLMGLFVFLLPLLVVKGAALFMSSPRPQVAVAVTRPQLANATVRSDPKRDWTDQERAAGARIADLEGWPCGPTPLNHRVSKGPDISIPVIGDHDGEVRLTPPDVKLQLIWGSVRGNVALIDGQRYREGDTLKDGLWIVRSIDAPNRQVILESVDGKQIESLSINPLLRTPSAGPRRR